MSYWLLKTRYLFKFFVMCNNKRGSYLKINSEETVYFLNQFSCFINIFILLVLFKFRNNYKLLWESMRKNHVTESYAFF